MVNIFLPGTYSSCTILIVGSGGREHALAWKVMQSPSVTHLFVSPGNGGTALMPNVTNVAINPTNISALVAFATEQNIDLIIVGPEAPLATGIVDACNQVGIACLGPTQAAAQLESSKRFAKEFMVQHNIPTAMYAVATTLQEAQQYIDDNPLPIVLKADGLAAGKGVVIAQTKDEAYKTAAAMLSGAAFGIAGQTIIFEEFLQGYEVSFTVLTDGKHYVPFATAQDNKTRDNDNHGPNTGGMGAYSPVPNITPTLYQRIIQEIIEPTIHGMAQQGIPFTGFLYPGLIVTPDGQIKVFEFNCRLGDPEAQTMLARLKTDFVALSFAAIEQKLDTIVMEWDNRKAVTVVVADAQYPCNKQTGQPISITPQQSADTFIFHAGTMWQDKQLVSSGGRILNVTALGDTFEQARNKAYAQIEYITLPHMHYRTDIAALV